MKYIFVSLIHIYRFFISPFFPPSCRFEPTCSRYAIHALQHHGFIKAIILIMKRLMRCQPSDSSSYKTSGYDPVPSVPSSTPPRWL
jgi:hypothetical protein